MHRLGDDDISISFHFWRGPGTMMSCDVQLAARYHLPVVYPWRFFTEIGGLISYGFNQRDSFRTAVVYIDRILKGEKPGNLPVQAPTRYELFINLKTAKMLGLHLPVSLVARADD